MGLRVNTNVFSLGAQRNLSQVSERLQGNFRRLSSGLRIATAADDAAGLGISEKMRAQIRSLNQASRNAQDGISLAGTAEGALQEVSTNLTRMRELAIQSANGTLSQDNRDVLDVEFKALIQQIDDVATQTDFNDIALLDGVEGTITLQVGSESGDTIDITLTDVQADSGLGLVGQDILDEVNSATALGVIDLAIDAVSTFRGNLGAAENRLQSTIRSLQTTSENLSAAESRIRDVDVARETADLTRNSILQQAATSVLAQANVQPQLALSLLG